MMKFMLSSRFYKNLFDVTTVRAYFCKCWLSASNPVGFVIDGISLMEILMWGFWEHVDVPSCCRI